jgi:hypothetical protein
VNFEPHDSIGGTWLQGYIDASYAELVAVFGEPNCPGDNYKVSTEWCMRFEDGTVATIYDWKLTNLYDDEMWTVSQMRGFNREWNIGGNTLEALHNVQDTLRDLRRTATLSDLPNLKKPDAAIKVG